MLQTHGKFMKYVLFTFHRMTPEQMKMNPIKPIIKVKTNEEHDAEEGESNTDEEESTISNKDEDKYSTFSDMSKQNSKSDINIDDTSEDENITEIETIEHYGEKIHETEESKPTESSQVLTVFNKTIHHEDDSSDDKSVIEIEPPKQNGEQEIENRTNSSLANFKWKLKTEVEGLITYSTDQQIFKFKVNSGSSQELWGVNIEFTLYELKWTIDAILQHMGFYCTTENPCVLMRINHKTKSCECIIIHQDELYIASNTLQEILHIVKDKYKIKINPNDYQESNFPYSRRNSDLLKAIYGNIICNLNVIHKKYTYQHYIYQIYQSKHYLLHINIPIYKKEENLIHDFIQETSYNKMRSEYCIMGSINRAMKMKHIYYISCFHTNILHIKFSWIHVMKNNIKITYQLVTRQET